MKGGRTPTSNIEIGSGAPVNGEGRLPKSGQELVPGAVAAGVRRWIILEGDFRFVTSAATKRRFMGALWRTFRARRDKSILQNHDNAATSTA
jgi:hypothetical protein